MRRRFWLCKRNGIYYSKDALTKQRLSLQTTNRVEAERLLHAKNEAEQQPMLSLGIAKMYLAAADPSLLERTWRQVMDEFCSKGKESTRNRRERAMRSKPFACIQTKKFSKRRLMICGTCFHSVACSQIIFSVVCTTWL